MPRGLAHSATRRQRFADGAIRSGGTPQPRERLRQEIALALKEDRAEAIVLGCAGMADLTTELRAEFGVPVVDGVAAAVKQAESLVSMGLITAKRGAYATLVAKPYHGLL